MLDSTGARSIDALLADDPATLDTGELKANLIDLARARARFDAAEAATIAEFDRRGCCVGDGALNTKAWLAHHTGVARATVGARVLLAKRLLRMPATVEALAAGRVTDGHARALGRCLTPRTLEEFARDETLLVRNAEALEADDFDIVISRWLQLNDPDGPDPGSDRPSQFRASPMLGGRRRLDGELDLEDSAEFLAELETIYDELWRADQAADDTDPLKTRGHAERNAAALVEMARRSSAAGDRDDELGDGATHRPRPRPRRPQLIVITDLEALAGDLIGSAELEDGTLLPQSILQRWACDSSLGRVVMSGRSIPIDLGTITYTASDGQRRALIARDRGCVIAGCKRKARWCEAHHVVPWPRGPTNLDNLVLLCKRHHKQIHAGIISLARGPGTEPRTAARSDSTQRRQPRPPARAA
jgi:hypothetical protein